MESHKIRVKIINWNMRKVKLNEKAWIQELGKSWSLILAKDFDILGVCTQEDDNAKSDKFGEAITTSLEPEFESFSYKLPGSERVKIFIFYRKTVIKIKYTQHASLCHSKKLLSCIKGSIGLMFSTDDFVFILSNSYFSEDKQKAVSESSSYFDQVYNDLLRLPEFALNNDHRKILVVWCNNHGFNVNSVTSKTKIKQDVIFKEIAIIQNDKNCPNGHCDRIFYGFSEDYIRLESETYQTWGDSDAVHQSQNRLVYSTFEISNVDSNTGNIDYTNHLYVLNDKEVNYLNCLIEVLPSNKFKHKSDAQNYCTKKAGTHVWHPLYYYDLDLLSDEKLQAYISLSDIQFKLKPTHENLRLFAQYIQDLTMGKSVAHYKNTGVGAIVAAGFAARGAGGF